MPPQRDSDPQILIGGASIQQLTIGASVQSRPIDAYILGQDSPVVLVMGAIHGDEPASEVFARQCLRHIQTNRHLYADLKIILIPAANPDGLIRGTRVNANGIDLNRNFPASNRVNNSRNGLTALSQPESAALYHLIETERPVLIISIHQPYGCVDYDGPAEPIARRMALQSGLPLRKIGARPGSLGSWAGEMLGIPIITLELRPEDSRLSPDELWARYGPCIKFAILGMN